MKENYIAVIQAGGKGIRMRELTNDLIPKSMLLLNGKPMIQWQIENISNYGIKEFIIIIGHLVEKIEQYFAKGSSIGVNIRYIKENEELGTAGALYYLKAMLHTNHFLMIYADVMFDLDWNRMIKFHESHLGVATLLVHPNEHPFDSDILIINGDNKVVGIDDKSNKRNYWYDNCVNAGIFILSTSILQYLMEPIRLDLETDILLPLMKKNLVFGYRTSEYVKDAGTVTRFRQIGMEQRKGIWKMKNISMKQKCVFLDRDGTINKYKGFISREEQFELEEGAAKAVRMLNMAGYLVIVVTNQSVVARGMCGIEDVDIIHKKMQTLLGNDKAYVDDCVFCPHHPDKGYLEENIIYKVKCSCRKPAIGLIEKMVEKYNIDLSQSYMIGDSTTDIQTGKNAGVKTILVLTGQAGTDGKYDATPDMIAENLLEAVNNII